jgi:hypothetical protein
MFRKIVILGHLEGVLDPGIPLRPWIGTRFRPDRR